MHLSLIHICAPKHNDYSAPVSRLNTLLPWIDHIREIGCTALYIGPLFESVGPVSYTHLDVYKRQAMNCVVTGDIRNIRREKDLGHRTNQKFHSLPYNRIYIMLEYKLKRYGIRFIKQEESYTSQCSPLSPEVGKRYAEPSNRKERGSYRDGNRVYNADAVGAYNILRKYHSVSGIKKELSVTGLKAPEIIKVAV